MTWKVQIVLRLGVLASGRGSNLAAILAAIDRRAMVAEVGVVISNNSGAGALALARDAGIDALHISTKTCTAPDDAILEALVSRRVNVLVLAGYLKKVAPRVIAAFDGRAVNIHPAPLPRFGGPKMYGNAVHQAVLDAGVSHSGPTVHRVTHEYDEGQILAHAPVPVRNDDTAQSLAARVLTAEHDLYWRTIAAHFADNPTK